MARLMPAVIATILMVVVALVCGQWSAVRVAAWHDVRLGLGGHYVLVSRLTRTFTTSPATACILAFFLSELLRALRMCCLV